MGEGEGEIEGGGLVDFEPNFAPDLGLEAGGDDGNFVGAGEEEGDVECAGGVGGGYLLGLGGDGEGREGRVGDGGLGGVRDDAGEAGVEGLGGEGGGEGEEREKATHRDYPPSVTF